MLVADCNIRWMWQHQDFSVGRILAATHVKMSDPDLTRRNFSFQMQIGLTREQVNVEGDLTLASLKEIACAFVDRKVSFVSKFVTQLWAEKMTAG